VFTRPRTVTAQITVPEGEISGVTVGQPVVLEARAYPERSFHGVVTAIYAAALREDARRIVKVTTVIDNADNLLKAELTENVKIRGDRRLVFDLMIRRVAWYVRVEFWSWWWCPSVRHPLLRELLPGLVVAPLHGDVGFFLPLRRPRAQRIAEPRRLR